MKEYVVYLVCNQKDIPTDSLALGECLGAFFDKEAAKVFLELCDVNFGGDIRDYHLRSIHVRED